MFHIIQSNDTDTLVDELLQFYQKHLTEGESLFSSFDVIVPSMVMGGWLNKQIAQKAGISTLFTAQFWGKYQWDMIAKVVKLDSASNPQDKLRVPEVAVLSSSVMRWHLFGFLSSLTNKQLQQILDGQQSDNDRHALHMLLSHLVVSQSDDVQTKQGSNSDDVIIPSYRLWQSCNEIAKLYVRYLTHRPNWLLSWAKEPADDYFDIKQAGVVDVKAMIEQKDHISRIFNQHEQAKDPSQNANQDSTQDISQDGHDTPDWLSEHYVALERLLHYLWHKIFGKVYLHREQLEQRFWQVLSGERGKLACQQALQALPKQLYVFTVQQIPQVELLFLRRLSLHIDVILFHFNPSEQFWADIVDKNWLDTQRIINPNSVYFKDYGHALLSRLGKESRETFAMLADMSGGEFYYDVPNSPSINRHDAFDAEGYRVQWQDVFVSHQDNKDDKTNTASLLNQLKQDILSLSTDSDLGSQLGQSLIDTLKTQSTPLSKLTPDGLHRLPSLSIHACHNLKRQLEIARVMIARYLNEPSDKPRQLSDVVVYLPDVQQAQSVIRAVFPESKGSDGLYLPIKITGTNDITIEHLMQAIAGFYRLLGAEHARFDAQEVHQWLRIPALYQSFGLDSDQVDRACALLKEAGFRRGFDAKHLQSTLQNNDVDYRYTFSYALDRIVAGFLLPNLNHATPFLYRSAGTNQHTAATLALTSVGLSDEPIVKALCAIHQALQEHRKCYQQKDKGLKYWLEHIENQVIKRYFVPLLESVHMRAIFTAINAMSSTLRANKYYQYDDDAIDKDDDIRIGLEFVLDSLTTSVGMQAVSSEPADVITFARFGALRSIPFGMTIMLDMNLSQFPRQDQITQLDLMKAGLKQRGDRYHEDDDNGAFLEAMLCTKDVCAIFYNAVADDGTTKTLPASCVGELLTFFKSQVRWQLPNDWQNSFDDAQGETLAGKIAQLLPNLIEDHLITHHTPTAFDVSNFSTITPTSDDQDGSVHDDERLTQQLKSLITKHQQLWLKNLPPAPIWRQVRKILDDGANQPFVETKPMTALPDGEQIRSIAKSLSAITPNMSDDDLQTVDCLIERWGIRLPTHVQLYTIYKKLHDPAGSYLSSRLHLSAEFQEQQTHEPLSLDNGQNWKLNDSVAKLIKAGKLSVDDQSVEGDEIYQHQQLLDMYHGSLLPAGVARKTTLMQALEQVRELVQFCQQDLEELAAGLGQSFDDEPKAFATPLSEATCVLSVGSHALNLTGALPDGDVKLWVSMQVSKQKPKHVLDAWLSHLLWQIARNTTKEQVACHDGVSVVYFRLDDNQKSGKTIDKVMLKAVSASEAKVYLARLVLYAHLIDKLPLPLTPSMGLEMIDCADDKYQLIDEMPSKATWNSEPGYNRGPEKDTILHPNWQLILGEMAAGDVWQMMLPMADRLYASLATHLIKDKSNESKATKTKSKSANAKANEPKPDDVKSDKAKTN